MTAATRAANASAHRYTTSTRKHSATHGVARNSSHAHLTHDKVDA